MKDKIKILHLASFSGNIGDSVSHLGFENILKTLKIKADLTRLEMRKFYDNYQEKDKRYFDEFLIDEINSYELCIVGGGGSLHLIGNIL